MEHLYFFLHHLLVMLQPFLNCPLNNGHYRYEKLKAQQRLRHEQPGGFVLPIYFNNGQFYTQMKSPENLQGE